MIQILVLEKMSNIFHEYWYRDVCHDTFRISWTFFTTESRQSIISARENENQIGRVIQLENETWVCTIRPQQSIWIEIASHTHQYENGKIYQS